MSNTKETELKKAWNLIIDYCEKSKCDNCMFDHSYCGSEPYNNSKIEV